MKGLLMARTFALIALLSLTRCLSSSAQIVNGGGEIENPSWTEATEPFHLLGPLYYVGTKGLAAWLISTTDGLILLNGGLPRSAGCIDSSIRKLGFRPEDIKFILCSHAHIAQVGTHAYFKKLSKAKVAIMLQDAAVLKTGGKKDFHYGNIPAFWYPPVRPDRQLLNKSIVTLGGVSLLAIRTPGHTRGATTWFMDITEGNRTYHIIFPDGYSVNPGYRIAVNPSYPEIEDDYLTTFQFLKKLNPDIFLPGNNSFYDFEKRRTRMATEGINAWVDSAAYQKFIIERQALYEAAVRKEVKDINLSNTSWRLVKYQGKGKDTSVITPAQRSAYTVTFGHDGRVAMKIDCNRGSGTWKLSGWGQIKLGPLALTRAACPADRLNTKLPVEWSTLNFFKLKGDHLLLSTKPQSSFYEFEVIPGTEPWRK